MNNGTEYSLDDLKMEYEIEIKFHHFRLPKHWEVDITKWKPCTEIEWYQHKGRKRYRFVKLGFWKIIDPR